MDPDPLTELVCRDLVETVTDYLEGAMPPADRARFEAHLETCPYCVDYVEQLRAIAGGLRGLPEESVAPANREAIVAAFRDWRGSL